MYRKVQNTADMQHYTSEEFGKHMEEILDRVEKDNIGVIIDHNNRSYVICPFEWVAPAYKLIDRMILRNVQGAVGRSQEYVDLIVEEIHGFAEWLTPSAIDRIIEEITGMLDTRFKMPCEDTWRSLVLFLEQHKNETIDISKDDNHDICNV